MVFENWILIYFHVIFWVQDGTNFKLTKITLFLTNIGHLFNFNIFLSLKTFLKYIENQKTKEKIAFYSI